MYCVELGQKDVVGYSLPVSIVIVDILFISHMKWP